MSGVIDKLGMGTGEKRNGLGLWVQSDCSIEQKWITCDCTCSCAMPIILNTRMTG